MLLRKCKSLNGRFSLLKGKNCYGMANYFEKKKGVIYNLYIFFSNDIFKEIMAMTILFLHPFPMLDITSDQILIITTYILFLNIKIYITT